MGLLAHVHRDAVHRSAVWRTRLDTTTTRSVVTLGVGPSIIFAAPYASALPLILVRVLLLALEARRDRHFNVWRACARLIERHLVGPVLEDGQAPPELDWRRVLVEDYHHTSCHASFLASLSRRARSNYRWVLLVQSMACLGKLVVHPTTTASVEGVVGRGAVGPIPGLAVLALGALYVAIWTVRAA